MAAYTFGKTLPGVDLAQARERITTALSAQGFGILTEIDLLRVYHEMCSREDGLTGLHQPVTELSLSPSRGW